MLDNTKLTREVVQSRAIIMRSSLHENNSSSGCMYISGRALCSSIGRTPHYRES